MEELTETTNRDALSFVPDIRYDVEAFDEIVLQNKAHDISLKLDQKQDAEQIAEVLRWGVDKLGQEELSDYLDDSVFGVDETIAELGLAKIALNLSKNPQEQAVQQAKYDSWKRIFDTYAAEYRPSLKNRYLQLANLRTKEQAILSVLTDDPEDKDRVVKYPEEMRLVTVPYKDIYQQYMPAYGQNDTTPSRITDPFGLLAQTYEGEVHVDPELLEAIRGFITPLDSDRLASIRNKIPPRLRTGIEFAETPIGELALRSSQMANFGLMLVGRKLQSRENLRIMTNETGVDCMAAGLAEGLAMCRFGYARIGDTVAFPKYIPNSEGDYYCGLNVERINYPYSNNPRLYFGLWKSEGSQNCLFAITADSDLSLSKKNY